MLLCERRGLVFKVFICRDNHWSKFKVFVIQRAVMWYLNRKVSVSVRFCCRWYPQNVLQYFKIGNLLHFSPIHWRRIENCFQLLLTTYVTGKYELWSRSSHFVFFLTLKFNKSQETVNYFKYYPGPCCTPYRKRIFLLFLKSRN